MLQGTKGQTWHESILYATIVSLVDIRPMHASLPHHVTSAGKGITPYCTLTTSQDQVPHLMDQKGINLLTHYHWIKIKEIKILQRPVIKLCPLLSIKESQ